MICNQVTEQPRIYLINAHDGLYLNFINYTVHNTDPECVNYTRSVKWSSKRLWTLIEVHKKYSTEVTIIN